jgi:sec-independent protein translocase protein TatA
MLAEIFSMDAIIVVVVVVAVLFGGTQIPKLARSLGSARSEFKKGLAEVEGSPTATESAPSAGTSGAA